MYNSRTNPGVVVYNALIVLLDLTFLLIKFWYYTLLEAYEAIKCEERDVANDIILITGTGHGIGKELSLQYSALGATIVCWDINEELNQETVKLIKSRGGKAHGYT